MRNQLLNYANNRFTNTFTEVKAPTVIPHAEIKTVGIDVTQDQLKLIKSKFVVFSSESSPKEHVLDFTLPSHGDVEIIHRILNVDTSPLKGAYVLLCE
jgi:hypothetical protein